MSDEDSWRTQDEKPLHVRVAEALGWTHIHPVTGTGYPPGGPIGDNPALPPGPLLAPRLGCAKVPRYDTDWSATGPLIERFDIDVSRRKVGIIVPSMEWWAAHDDLDDCENGPTPLLAICYLILALHAAGKLDGAGR